jgi:hypothetical protein
LLFVLARVSNKRQKCTDIPWKSNWGLTRFKSLL